MKGKRRDGGDREDSEREWEAAGERAAYESPVKSSVSKLVRER